MGRIRPYALIIVVLVAACALTAAVELAMGRLVFGPDGRFGWWEGDIWSSEQSQRLADPYSVSHIVMLIHPLDAIKAWQMNGHCIP